MSRLTVLVSGGPDSLVLWRLAQAQGREPHALYLSHGHASDAAEREVLGRVATSWDHFGVHLLYQVATLDLAGRQDPDTGHIPLRNDLFVRRAALDADEVWLGALAGESSRDKSGRFLRDTSRSLTFLLGRPVSVRAPVKHLTKRALLAHYLKLFPQEAAVILPLTRSCYRLDTLSATTDGCGACPACWRRWLAFAPLGLPLHLAADPRVWARERERAQGGRLATIRATLRRVPVWEWPGLLTDALDQRAALREVPGHV